MVCIKQQLYDIVLKACWSWCSASGFQFIPTPKITRATGACESVNTLFDVSSVNVVEAGVPDFVGYESDPKSIVTNSPKQFFFAQTGQLYLEMALAETEKCFTFGSSGRAEHVVDSRHLREFTLFEVEAKGAFYDLKRTIVSLFGHIDGAVRNAGCGRQLGELVEVSYSEAVQSLGLNWGEDIHHEDEQKLIHQWGGPVLLTEHPDPQPPEGSEPLLEKFFNMKPKPLGNEGSYRVQSCDLLLPISGESVGGAVRIHDAVVLRQRLLGSGMFANLKRLGIGIEQFDGYLNHMTEHGGKIGEHFGFGVGIDRVCQFYMGESDIRNAAGFLVT